MLFVGFALLIAAGLALVISSDAGSLVGLTETQTGQMVPLLIILVLVAGGAFSRRRRFGELMTNLVLWVGIFGVAIIGYTYRHEVANLASRVTGELAPGIATVSADRAIVSFRRAMGGSFRVNVGVNGVRLPMVFDTGATAVVLTFEDAIASGIVTEDLLFNIRVQTANGVGRAAAVSLPTMVIGSIERHNIRAFIAEEEALETSLLGMSFLETLSSYGVRNDSLELRD